MFDIDSKQGQALRDFYTMLAVCHTVMVEKGDAPEVGAIMQDEDDLLQYSASSADELALVKGARDVGIVYNKRTAQIISIKLGGERYGAKAERYEDYEARADFKALPDDQGGRLGHDASFEAGPAHPYLDGAGCPEVCSPRPEDPGLLQKGAGGPGCQ
jgi:hypothetical protein